MNMETPSSELAQLASWLACYKDPALLRASRLRKYVQTERDNEVDFCGSDEDDGYRSKGIEAIAYARAGRPTNTLANVPGAEDFRFDDAGLAAADAQYPRRPTEPPNSFA